MEAKFATDFVDDVFKKGSHDDDDRAAKESSDIAESKNDNDNCSFDSAKSTQRTRRESVQMMADENTVIIMPSIVNEVCEYFYEEDELLDEIEDFLKKAKGEFKSFFDDKLDGREPEYELSFSDHYLSYKLLIESKITSFVESKGYTLHTFYNELAAKVGSSDDLTTGTNIATAISSITTFPSFMGMMEDYVVEGVSPCICPPLLNTETNELEFS